MTKRTTLFASVAVLILLSAASGAYAVTRTSTTPHFWAEAKATRATVACLQANPKLDVPKSARDNIEMIATSYLADVPAGTYVDVKLASYSPTKVTGSSNYASKYGSYNFVMTKQSDGWHFTDFKHCH
jgi:hypothetical protein